MHSASTGNTGTGVMGGPKPRVGALARYVFAATLVRSADGGALVAIVLLAHSTGVPGLGPVKSRTTTSCGHGSMLRVHASVIVRIRSLTSEKPNVQRTRPLRSVWSLGCQPLHRPETFERLRMKRAH